VEGPEPEERDLHERCCGTVEICFEGGEAEELRKYKYSWKSMFARLTYIKEDGRKEIGHRRDHDKDTDVREEEEVGGRSTHDSDEGWSVPCDISLASTATAEAINCNMSLCKEDVSLWVRLQIVGTGWPLSLKLLSVSGKVSRAK
jgi:hypothetical protein